MPGSGASKTLHGHARGRGRFLLRLLGLGDVEHLAWLYVASVVGSMVWILLLVLVMRANTYDWTEIQRLWERNRDDMQRITARLDKIIRLLEACGGPGGATARPLKSK